MPKENRFKARSEHVFFPSFFVVFMGQLQKQVAQHQFIAPSPIKGVHGGIILVGPVRSY